MFKTDFLSSLTALYLNEENPKSLEQADTI